LTPVAAPDLLDTVPMLFEIFLVGVRLWVREAAAPACATYVCMHVCMCVCERERERECVYVYSMSLGS
jgi:hypothetical protein